MQLGGSNIDTFHTVNFNITKKGTYSEPSSVRMNWMVFVVKKVVSTGI